MSVLLTAAAVGLLASLPLAGVAWAAGLLTERATRAPRLREGLWTLAFALPVFVVAAVMIASVLPWLSAPEPLASSRPFPVVIPVSPATSTGADNALLREVMRWGAMVLSLIAVAGAAVRLARVGLGYRRLRGLAVTAVPLGRPAVAEAVRATAERFGVTPPPVLVHHDVAQPLLAGFRRPAVLLPAGLAQTGSDQQLAFICAHELAHLARRDNLRLVLDEAVAGLFWFNPAMSAIRERMAAAREEVCDQIVLAEAAPAARRLYAHTLMQALRPPANAPQTAFTGSARSTAMRLQAILTPAAPARAPIRAGAVGLCAALVAAAGAGSVAAAQAAREAAPAPAASSKAVPSAGPSSIPEDPSKGPWIVWGPGWAPAPWSNDPRPTRTVAGPDVVIKIDGRQQPDGFVLESLDPISIRKLAITRLNQDGRRRTTFEVLTTGPDLFRGEPAKFTPPPPRPPGPHVGASIGPEGLKLNRRGYRENEVEIAIDDRVQPAGFKLEAIDARKVTAVGTRPVKGPGPATHRVDVRTTPQPEFTCPPAAVCVLSAEVIVSKPNEYPKSATYRGNPEIIGTATGSDDFLIDGRPAPAGLDLRTIATETIDRIEVTSLTKDGRPRTADTDPAEVRQIFRLFTKR